MILFHKRSRPFNQIQILFVLSFKHLSSWDYLKKKKEKETLTVEKKKGVYPEEESCISGNIYMKEGKAVDSPRAEVFGTEDATGTTRPGLLCIYIYISI